MEQIPCLKDMLSCAGVTDFCVVLMNSSFILYPHKVSELGFTPNSAIVCLFPYYTQTPVTQTNLARYAWSKDYHIVVGNRLKEICAALKDCAPNYEFQGFTDNSPFLEKDMAIAGGLCVKGRHNLCISEQFGTYFFIGEIVTDLKLEEQTHIPPKCCGFMPCVSACPTGALCLQNGQAVFRKELCLSFISQKKGAFSKGEQALFSKAKTAWGCDLCQEACVKNKQLKTTHIKEFLEIKPSIALDEIEDFSNKQYQKQYKDRVYSWRGKEAMIRNLKLLSSKNLQE